MARVSVPSLPRKAVGPHAEQALPQALLFYEMLPERVSEMIRERTSSRRTQGRDERRSAMAEERRPRKRKPRPRREGSAAAVVIAAMILCMTIVVFAVWISGVAIQPEAVPTGGMAAGQALARAPAQSGGTSGRVPAAEGFQQLSDPLLVLVNDQIPIPEDWQVTPAFINDETVDNRMYEDMSAMFQAGEQEGVSFWVCSGYRSQELQESILEREIAAHMRDDGMTEEEARELSLRTINRPGYSEHHTGLAIDLNDVSDDFEQTDTYRWLQAHAAEYGFVQRYRSDKVEYTGIDNESWHYRYVDREHAQEMQRLDMCLEEYVQYLKDQGVQ